MYSYAPIPAPFPAPFPPPVPAPFPPPVPGPPSRSFLLPVVVGIVLLLGGGIAVYFLLRPKKSQGTVIDVLFENGPNIQDSWTLTTSEDKSTQTLTCVGTKNKAIAFTTLSKYLGRTLQVTYDLQTTSGVVAFRAGNELQNGEVSGPTGNFPTQPRDDKQGKQIDVLKIVDDATIGFISFNPNASASSYFVGTITIEEFRIF